MPAIKDDTGGAAAVSSVPIMASSSHRCLWLIVLNVGGGEWFGVSLVVELLLLAWSFWFCCAAFETTSLALL